MQMTCRYNGFDDTDQFYGHKGTWPCSWIAHPAVQRNDEPVVAAYGLSFSVKNSMVMDVAVSADQRYELYLDGCLIGRGCESGAPESWFYSQYRLDLSAGRHVLAAKVWSWGRFSPAVQMEVFHGFILCPYNNEYVDIVGTGHAAWQTMLLDGISFQPHIIKPNEWIGAPPPQRLDAGKFQWNWHQMGGDKWQAPVVAGPGFDGFIRYETGVHRLKPATLPVQFERNISVGIVKYVSSISDQDAPLNSEGFLSDELSLFSNIIDGGKTIIPPFTSRRILIDLEDYYCAWPILAVADGKDCEIKITWSESLFENPEGSEKGNRRQITGKYFRGVGDQFICDGSPRELTTLVWRAGRYVLISLKTASSPLTIVNFKLLETRYPLELQGCITSSEQGINDIIPICLRSIQESSHENYVDCPFYEQMLYSGDGRLEALTNYVISADTSLARKALMMFDESRHTNGLSMARYPSAQNQLIPSFSLWYVAMVYDYSYWQRDRAFIVSLIPGVRAVMEYFISRRSSDGFVTAEKGMWHFVDWAEDWKKTANWTPPGADSINVTTQWLFVYILGLAAELEDYVEEPMLAARYREIASKTAQKLVNTFWDDKRGLFREDETGNTFSQHCQLMALLSGRLSETMQAAAAGNLLAPEITRVSLFFTHYLFEVCGLMHLPELFFSELGKWNKFLDEGFVTVPENFINSRSDCHGWGGHPLYHLIKNVAGIRPAAKEFREVHIAPMLGNLEKFKVECVHPDGMIKVEYSKEKGRLHCNIILPPPLSGIFKYEKHMIELKSGEQTFII